MKKIILATLSLSLILAAPVTALAADTVSAGRTGDVREEDNSIQSASVSDSRWNMPGGAREATEEIMRQAEERLAEIDERELYGEGLNEGIMPLNDWYSVFVPYYGQETEVSCGPACVRMVLECLTGNSYDEKTIRDNTNYSDEAGTYLYNLVPYLNQEQDKHEYLEFYRVSEEKMRDLLYSGLANFSKPAIIGIRPSASVAFPWNGSNGHFLVVDGCNASKSVVSVLDPWAGYSNNDEYKWYDLEMGDLYDGYDAINCGLAR